LISLAPPQRLLDVAAAMPKRARPADEAPPAGAPESLDDDAARADSPAVEAAKCTPKADSSKKGGKSLPRALGQTIVDLFAKLGRLPHEVEEEEEQEEERARAATRRARRDSASGASSSASSDDGSDTDSDSSSGERGAASRTPRALESAAAEAAAAGVASRRSVIRRARRSAAEEAAEWGLHPALVGALTAGAAASAASAVGATATPASAAPFIQHFFAVQRDVVPTLIAADAGDDPTLGDVCIAAPTGSGKTLA
jgi:superfamily II DNA/RNA helicase